MFLLNAIWEVWVIGTAKNDRELDVKREREREKKKPKKKRHEQVQCPIQGKSFEDMKRQKKKKNRNLAIFPSRDASTSQLWPLAPDPAVFGFTGLFHGTYLYSLVESVACLARENYPWLSINRLSSSFYPKNPRSLYKPWEKVSLPFQETLRSDFHVNDKDPVTALKESNYVVLTKYHTGNCFQG